MLGNLLNKVIGPIFEIIDKSVVDKDEANRLKSEINQALIAKESALQEAMKEIAVAEIKGNWFQSSWRPLLSYVLIFLIAWVGFFHGVMEAVFGVEIRSITFDDLITFGTVWASVYGLGRTFEKSGSSLSFKK